jgi:hypothetical protein
VIIAVIIGVFILVVLLFVPIKSQTFNSVVENKYDFFNRGALTVDYSRDNVIYEKDVFLPYKIYNKYSIGDNYNLTIKESVLTSIPETYIFTAAIVSAIVVPIIIMLPKLNVNHKVKENDNGKKD